MVKNIKLKDYKNYLKQGTSSYLDISFNEIYVLNEKDLQKLLLKKALKEDYKKDISSFKLNMDELKKHLWYNVDIYGINESGKSIQIGNIKEYSKLTPKQFYMKYAPVLFEWKSNSYFVQKSGENYAWKEKVESLSKKNQFMNGGIPTDFKIRISFVN